MIKTELIDHIEKNASISKVQSEKAVNTIFSSISSALKKGNAVRFIGFGTFNVNKRKARNGKNPCTGEATKILLLRL